MPPTQVNIGISPANHRRLTEIRERMTQAKGRPVTINEVLETLIDRAAIMEGQ
jgi:hypothetical protein